MPPRPKTIRSIRVDSDLIDKLKYIGVTRRSNFTIELTQAMLNHIAEFEKQNGKITDKQLKEAGITGSN